MTRHGDNARGLVLGAQPVRDILRHGAAALRMPARLAAFRLFWVREAFRLEALWDEACPSTLTATTLRAAPVWFEADCGAPAPSVRSAYEKPFGRLRPAVTMPRWASRFRLKRDEAPFEGDRFWVRLDQKTGERA